MPEKCNKQESEIKYALMVPGIGPEWAGTAYKAAAKIWERGNSGGLF